MFDQGEVSGTRRRRRRTSCEKGVAGSTEGSEVKNRGSNGRVSPEGTKDRGTNIREKG